jgi:beta-lactamase superfamily II metal-dependent hydrolase
VTPFPEKLDRRLLNVFVFGPGIGEAIAVALPRAGWLFVDGCREVIHGEERFPALDTYERYRGVDDPVEAVVWSHPHADHYQGIIEAIDRCSPRRIGFSHLEAPEPGSARLETEALGGHPRMPRDLKLQESFGLLRSTFERIFSVWREHPESRWLLSSASAPLELGSVRVRACSPDLKALRALFSRPAEALRNELSERANEHSVVLELQFGEARVVLGGDLPHLRNASILPHGWQKALAVEPKLASYGALKVPHHGSIEAIHPALVGPAAGKARVVTPFVRQRLPRLDDEGGMKALSSEGAIVRMTSPGSARCGAKSGETMTRKELSRLAIDSSAPLPGEAETVCKAQSAFDHGWGFAIDFSGAVRSWFAGQWAVSIAEESTGSF